ncbi:MAG: hypothetical protein R3B51_14705 [Thermodesulfobacteriota bacterium]
MKNKSELIVPALVIVLRVSPLGGLLIRRRYLRLRAPLMKKAARA